MKFCTRTISAFVLSMSCLFFGITTTSAQNGQFDVRFTIKNFDCANNKVTFLIQVKAHDAAHTFLLGDANYRFDYDPRVIKNPAIVSQENFSNQAPSSDLNYIAQNLNGSSVGSTLGTVSLNTIYGGGGIGAKLVPATWTNVSCIRFDIQDATKCFELLWHDDTRFPITGMNEVVLSGLNDGNYNAFVVAAGGVFQNYAQCTPSVCSGMEAIDDINVTNKNASVAGNAATNDVSFGGTMSFTLLSQSASSGNLVLNNNGTYIYTPATDFVGEHRATYQVCNAAGLCDTASIVINVLDHTPIGVNSAPIAQNDNAQTKLNTPVTGSVLSNDFDVNSNALTVGTTPTLLPSNGTVSINADGSYTYTPTNGFVGQDTFRYQVCDNGTPSLCDTAMVVVTISIDNNGASNNPPNTQDDSKTTPKNVAVIIPVKANDTDPNGNTLATPSVSTNPTNGSIVVNGDGTITYTPNNNFIGSDKFTYSVCDNGTPVLCDSSTVYITVTKELNLPPVITVTPITTPEDSTKTLCVPVTDPNVGQTLTASLCAGYPKNGTTGTPSVSNGQVCFSYTPTPNYNGVDTICLIVCDDDNPSLCDTAKIPITVTPVDDKPIVTTVPVTLPEDSTITICQTITDADLGDTFSASLCSQPAHGSAGTPVVGGNQVCLQYTPTVNFNGQDTVCIIVCDQTGKCDTAKVPVTVTPVDDKPIVTTLPVTLPEDSTITICQTITDPDVGDTFSASLCGQPAHGSTGTPIVTGNQVCLQYTPTANFNGQDTVCIIVCDQTGKCDTAKVPVTVTPVDDKPIVTTVPVTLPEDSTITICQTITDPDVGDTFSASLCSQPAHGLAGTPVVTGNQVCVQYTPTANFNGQDTVCIIVCDQTGKCDTAKVPVTVTPVDDKPVVTKVPVTLPEDSIITICQTITDPDVGDTFSASLCSQPAHGTAGTPVVTGNQVCLQYTPTANFNGQDTVCIIVCDQTGKCDTAKVPVTVTPVDDKPVVTKVPVTLPEDSLITICQTITDPDAGSIFSASLCSQPAQGTAGTPVVTGNQVCLQYTPTANFNGQYTVCIIVCDQTGKCDTAKVPVTVTPVNDKPNIGGTTVTTTDKVPVTVCLPITDSDTGNTFTPSLCGVPATGITSLPTILNGQICVQYTPTISASVGTQTVCVQVCDAGGLCDTAHITIIVKAANEAPLAMNDINNTIKNTSTNGNVLINDYDPDFNLLSATLITPAQHGILVLNSNGIYTYTPVTGFIGTDTAFYTACDNAVPSFCDTAMIVIEVREPNVGNQSPIANNDNVTTPSNHPIVLYVTSNDYDPDNGQTISHPTLLGSTIGGTSVVNSNGSITFTPTLGFVGDASFNYSICDDGTPVLCDTATAFIRVYPDPTLINLAPIAVDDANTTTGTTPVAGTVAANDTDPNAGQILTYTGLGNGAKGTAVVNSDGTYIYTPNSGTSGWDVFSYQVCDNGTPSLCDTAIVSIFINSPIVNTNTAPVATPDNPITNKGVPVTINVKANDYDPDGDALGLPTITTAPTCGTVTVNANGSITFVPDSNFTGVCTFIYQVCDTRTPAACDTALVSVKVDAIVSTNKAPVAVNDGLVGFTGQIFSAKSVATNDSDPDSSQILSYTQLTLAAKGIVAFNSAGTFTYSPLATFITGRDSFRYKVCDNGSPSLCDTAWVFVEYTPNPNNTNVAPIALDDNSATSAGTKVNIPVKNNDNDPNGALTLGNPTLVAQPVCGTATVLPNGSVDYTPTTGFAGDCSFQYVICDTVTPSLCDTATITVSVAPPVVPVNRAPVAQNDATTTATNTPINGNVASNDSDLDAGQTLTFSKVTNPANGSVIVNADGTFTYTPTTGFVGRDSFTYRVCDNGSPNLCTTATSVIVVTPLGVNQNDAPIATDDKVRTTPNVPVVINVKANDFDPDGSANSLSNPVIVGTSVGGTPSVNPDGTVTFVPTTGFVGTATFSYQICDNGSPILCDTAVVTITVSPLPVNNINLSPIAVDDAQTGYINRMIVGTTSGNDSDPNSGQTLSYNLINQPANGLVTSFDAVTGNFSYTPIANYIGTDYFVYSVCDNGTPSLCDTAAVYLSVLDNPCITIDLKVLLEGPYSTSTGKMRTGLNQRGLLPGQTPVGQFAVKTENGHPYKNAPWNYAGTEGDTITTYPSTVVDWVLISLRSATNTTAAVWRCAAWLHDDGTITVPGKSCSQIPTGSYFIVIEHRNHLGVMSPSAVTIGNNRLAFDFTSGDAFVLTNPPSFGAKAMSNGKWVMYSGDGKKDTQNTNFDINFNDSQLWKLQSGIFDQYRYGDFNLDADINFSDQVLWKTNNGRYSGVPH